MSSLGGYIFHRSAHERQKPILWKLLEEPQAGAPYCSWLEGTVHAACSSDPNRGIIYANRMEISICGPVRASNDSAEVLTTHVLILSSILDHTSSRSCQCLGLAMKQRRGIGNVEVINLVSDSGPPYRAYENMWYNCLKLPVQQQAEVRTDWGVEST